MILISDSADFKTRKVVRDIKLSGMLYNDKWVNSLEKKINNP